MVSLYGHTVVVVAVEEVPKKTLKKMVLLMEMRLGKGFRF